MKKVYWLLYSLCFVDMAYLKYSAPTKPVVTEAIIKEARDISFLIKEIPDTIIMQWYEAMAYSRNTKPDFVLLASLGVVSAILGPKTKIKIREGSTNRNARNPRKAYVEYPGLFLTILSEPGSGKSTEHQLAVQDPLDSQLDEEPKMLIVQVQIKYIYFLLLIYTHQLKIRRY